MTAIEKFTKKSAEMTRSAAEARMEEERMRDVLLLIDSLFRREETTARLILDCLYDVGSVNLINQKLQSRPINRLMKGIAKLSKPAFRAFGLRWMKKNCPGLIANWMHSKVTFDKTENTPEAAVIEAQTDSTNILEETQTADLEVCTQEIVRLRSQVRTLTALLVGVTISLGSAFALSIW